MALSWEVKDNDEVSRRRERSSHGPPREAKRRRQKTTAEDSSHPQEEDGSKMEKPKDGEEPETSSAFKKWMAKQPKVPSIAEQKENEKAEEEARSPVTKSMDSKASKLLAGAMPP